MSSAATQSAWYLDNGNSGAPFPPPWWGYQIPGWLGNGIYYVGDFNGDKCSDIAYITDDRWYIVNGKTGGPFPAPWWGNSIPGWPTGGRYFIGDFNGDGSDDIAFLAADAKWYIVNGNSGAPFGHPWWGNSIPGWPADGRYFIGDFNGDGASDIAFLAADAKWYIVNGNSGAPFGNPWWGNSIPGWPADGRYFIGDFNGDGASDIAFLAADAKWYIVNGNSGAPFGHPWWGNSIPGWPADGRYFIGDFNGDKASDIAFLATDAKWYIVNGNSGAPFPPNRWGFTIPGWPSDGKYFIGDFNGDHAADFAFLRSLPAPVTTTQHQHLPPPPPPPPNPFQGWWFEVDYETGDQIVYGPYLTQEDAQADRDNAALQDNSTAVSSAIFWTQHHKPTPSDF
jgi:hypothetical protein